MRVLLLLERMPVPAEAARTSVDSDWATALSAHHDVVVAVDENTDGASALRDAGITVLVSDKRHVTLPGGDRADADAVLAAWIATRHRDTPFDLVVASPDRPAFGAVRAALAGVPWGVFAAEGPTALARRLGVDREWLGRHGQELWRAASNVAAADLVISPVAPSLLGLDVGSTPVGALQPPPEPDLRPNARGDLVVIAATGVSTVDATRTMERAMARIDTHDAMTIVVLHTPELARAAPIGPALAAGIPPELAAQTVLVPTERHGRAGDWVAAADALVLADAGELAVPVVARHSAAVPTVLLTPPPAGWLSRIRPAMPPPPPRGAVELLPWTSPRRVATQLRALRRSPAPDAVVVHLDTAVEEATRWLDLAGLDRFDVVVGAPPRPPWSIPRPDKLAADLVCLHRRTWTAVADELDHLDDLTDLLGRVADLGGVRSHTLAAVAVTHEPATTVDPGSGHPPMALLDGPLPTARPPLRAATTHGAGTPDADETTVDPSVALRAWAKSAAWPGRARLALPWSLGLADAVQRGAFPDGVAAWARQHTITDRARLLLPWKWGLLPRAMEDRW